MKTDKTLSWFLVIVNSRSEKKVADLLRRRGFDVLLPLQRSARRWSDRTKVTEFPLFACNLFCRCEPKDYLSVVHTPGVCGKPIQVADFEIDYLIRILAADYPIRACTIPTGAHPTVSFTIDQSIHGQVIVQGPECEVVVPLRTIGGAVSMNVPFEALIFQSSAPVSNNGAILTSVNGSHSK